MASFIEKALKKFATLLIFLITLSLIPCIILMCLILLTIRGLLGIYKTLFKREYGYFLTGMSNCFSTDSPYHNPAITVGGYIFFDGHIDFKDFRENFSKKFRSSPLLPQLKQYLTTWMGFSVWRDDPHFSIDNHVKELKDPLLKKILGVDDKYISEGNVLEVLHKFVKIPFAPRIAPWDFHLYHQVKLKNRNSPVSVLFVRVHHTLGDASAIMKLFSLIFDGQKDPLKEIVEKLKKGLPVVKRSGGQKLAFYLTYPILSLWEAVEHLVESWDRNAWNNWKSPLRTDFHYVGFSVAKTEIQETRKLHQDVSFFSVVLAAQTAALRRYMHKYNVPIPETLHANITIAIPSSSQRLTNNMTLVCVTLPVGLNNRNQIVQRIHEEQTRLKTSRVPLFFLALGLIDGLLPRKLIYSTWRLTTCAATNFPGLPEKPSMLGKTAFDMGAVACTPSTIGLYLWSFGFDTTTNISFGASKDIMPDKSHAAECSRFVQEELQAMKQLEDPYVIPEQPCTSRAALSKKFT